LFHEISDFQDGQSAELFDDVSNISHGSNSVFSPDGAPSELWTTAVVPTRNWVGFVWFVKCRGGVQRAVRLSLT
jgi:hypothetical protein